MTSAQRIRDFPKTGWQNGLARWLLSLKSKPAATRYLDYQTQTTLSLPFAGEWYVYWGGRAIAQNYHARARDQRFAYDFMILRDGRSHSGTGRHNEDYFCFGQSIHAPGPGTVVAMDNGEPDRTPGEMPIENPLGNHVIIDHGCGEFSFLAHLRQGSVAVRLGDQVFVGQSIAECGNSGHSSEPHLHYHLQTTGIVFRGDGLPAQFVNYVADNNAITRGEPVAGQQVRNPV
jgi:murein DD-endopeptidase MepM/ murein hydrolase activator NlpD